MEDSLEIYQKEKIEETIREVARRSDSGVFHRNNTQWSICYPFYFSHFTGKELTTNVKSFCTAEIKFVSDTSRLTIHLEPPLNDIAFILHECNIKESVFNKEFIKQIDDVISRLSNSYVFTYDRNGLNVNYSFALDTTKDFFSNDDSELYTFIWNAIDLYGISILNALSELLDGNI